MTTIQALEQAVQLLPPRLVEFRRWFTRFDEAWDAQIAAHAAAEKLDALATEATAES